VRVILLRVCYLVQRYRKAKPFILGFKKEQLFEMENFKKNKFIVSSAAIIIYNLIFILNSFQDAILQVIPPFLQFFLFNFFTAILIDLLFIVIFIKVSKKRNNIIAFVLVIIIMMWKYSQFALYFNSEMPR